MAIAKIGAGMYVLGIAAITGIVGAAKIFSDTGDALDKMAQRTGITVEALSALGFAARASGTDIEAVESGVKRMQKVLGAAAAGSKMAAKTLGTVGLTLADLQNLSPEDQLKVIADQISKMTSPAQRAAAAMKLFGSTALLPMMEGGAAGVEKLMQRARELGLVMSGADAKAAAGLNDALGELYAVIHRTVELIGAAATPAVKAMAERITAVIVGVNKWVDKNRGLVITILNVAAGVATAGAAVVGLGFSFIILSKAIGVIFAPLKLLPITFEFIKTALLALSNPVVLLGVGFIAAAAAVIYFSGAGAQAAAIIGRRFTDLKTSIKSAIKGIVDALAKGDVETAGKILWTALELVWFQGLAAITELLPSLSRAVDAIGETILAIWIRVTAAWKIITTSALSLVRSAWYSLGVSIIDVYMKIFEAIRPVSRAIAVELARVAGKLQGMSDEEIEQHITATIDTNLDAERAKIQSKAAELRGVLQSNADQEKGDRAAQIRAAIAEEEKLLAELGKISADRDAADVNERLKKVAEYEAKIAALKAQLAKLTAQAAEPLAEPKPRDKFKLPSIAAGLSDADKRSGVGAFEGAAKALLGLSAPGDKLDKVVDAIGESNELLQEISDGVGEGGLLVE